MQIDCSWISLGAKACPALMQAYAAFGFFAVICQKGYLIIPGVLPQTIISLGIKQSFFVKSGFLKAVIDIGRKYEIVFSPNDFQQFPVNRLWRVYIAIIVKPAAEERPEPAPISTASACFCDSFRRISSCKYSSWMFPNCSPASFYLPLSFSAGNRLIFLPDDFVIES